MATGLNGISSVDKRANLGEFMKDLSGYSLYHVEKINPNKNGKEVGR
jgi:hypothetical protein